MKSAAFLRMCRSAMCLAGAGFLLLTPPSYYRYSAVGIDTDRLDGTTITHSYYRLRWPGDGTVRCGIGEKLYSLDEEDLDPVDLAGRLFQKPTTELHRSAKWGFAVWHSPEAYDTEDGRHLWARWMSVPAWLPGVLLLGTGLVIHRCRLME